MNRRTQMMFNAGDLGPAAAEKTKTSTDKRVRLCSPALCGRTGRGLVAAAFLSVFYQNRHKITSHGLKLSRGFLDCYKTTAPHWWEKDGHCSRIKITASSGQDVLTGGVSHNTCTSWKSYGEWLVHGGRRLMHTKRFPHQVFSSFF